MLVDLQILSSLTTALGKVDPEFVSLRMRWHIDILNKVLTISHYGFMRVNFISR